MELNSQLTLLMIYILSIRYGSAVSGMEKVFKTFSNMFFKNKILCADNSGTLFGFSALNGSLSGQIGSIKWWMEADAGN